ncbi:division plane positioning ATPase MipZ [Asticcacaulis sp. EMRT-3]|uniref:division plane positioning ATPase MipZ n=1 Tax=Asticcacaulis sp. EMRT-3 TaxID=3040349 RepID=UPI0024AEC28A|nr:division plane positioning ATPase MipZ [Asticcacaulis sp. EMRT-3]MDI7774210.1 division plane positioning ATPase MipZ [Asticcacaulis sp. EMRT-3]
MSQARILVFGNEKGGAGKSTVAMHVAVHLLHQGKRVAFIDLDLRQRSLARFFSNRARWAAANEKTLLQAFEPFLADKPASLLTAPENEAKAAFDRALDQALDAADYVIIDTPGGDHALSRRAHAVAHLIITPMNDSFIDFDLLGEVDPVTLEVKRPSIYAETVWNSRKTRAAWDGKSIGWIVLRNRLAQLEARNRRRVDERVTALGKRVGFEVLAGLRDRVIYRELFPFGLTVADLSEDINPVAMSLSHVSARQELRALMASLGLEAGSDTQAEPEFETAET